MRNRVFYLLEVILWGTFIAMLFFGSGGLIVTWGAQFIWSVIGINCILGLLYVPQERDYVKATQMPLFVKRPSALWARDFPSYLRRAKRLLIVFAVLGVAILALVFVSVFTRA